jgi:hypothetical protein
MDCQSSFLSRTCSRTDEDREFDPYLRSPYSALRRSAIMISTACINPPIFPLQCDGVWGAGWGPSATNRASRILIALLFGLAVGPLPAEDNWAAAIARMPLGPGIPHLDRTNAVPVMLHALLSNECVKALVFMPGATDEFYMFRRAKAKLANRSPSLLDAVSALTNQTRIRASFRRSMLLLHTEEDSLSPATVVQDASTAEKLKRTLAAPHLLLNDRDWDHLQPILKWPINIDLRPWKGSCESWHFYRHSFAGWNLSGWEALEAAALAGKSRFTVRRHQVIFEVDRRVYGMQ